MLKKIIIAIKNIFVHGGDKMVLEEIKLDNIKITEDIRFVNPLDLSKFILRYFDDKNSRISHKKLQKLVYYVDAWASM